MSGAINRTGGCQCSDCQKQSASAFCPQCGTRIYHGADVAQNRLSIKGGSLDDTSWLRPVAHIWLRSAQPWIDIDPSKYACYAKGPDDDTLLEQRRLQQLTEG